MRPIFWRFYRGRISPQCSSPVAAFLFVAKNVDGVAVALAHLWPSIPGQLLSAPECGAQATLKLPVLRDPNVSLIRGRCRRDLNVLLLIFPDRDNVAVVN